MSAPTVIPGGGSARSGASRPLDSPYLHITGDTVVPRRFARAPGAWTAWSDEQLAELEIVVERRCSLRVEPRNIDEADAIAVDDQAGVEQELSALRSTSRHSRLRVPLHAGGTEALVVAESARRLVLYLEGERVRDVELQLSPEALTTLRP